jgi:hypothetical protein
MELVPGASPGATKRATTSDPTRLLMDTVPWPYAANETIKAAAAIISFFIV